MANLWQWISYYRHRSELRAVNLALRVPFLAMLPIGIMLGFWWVLPLLPIVLSALLLIEIFGPVNEMLLGVLALGAVLLVSVALLLVAPWFFGWYGIAVGLMFGRPAQAIAKRQFLVGAIRAYRMKAG